MASRFIKTEHDFIDCELRTLTPSEFMVWMVLRRYENIKTHRCYPSEYLISDRTGLSRSTVHRALEGLKARGYINITLSKQSNGGFANIYTMQK